jgi:phytoene dehydrogenase-like protein
VKERMTIDVAIIGAGHNGLVAATYLARAGLAVQVFERRAGFGGATLNEELWPGYTFSTGAHLLHAVPAKLVRELQLVERGLQLVPRDEAFYLHADGTYHGSIAVDRPNNCVGRSKLTPPELAGLTAYNQFKQTLMALVRPYLLRTPPSLAELAAKAAGTPAAEVLRMATTMKLWAVQDHFLPTSRLREAFATEASAVIENPLAFALAYGAIDTADPLTGEKPPFGFVRGGMGRFAACLMNAAREAGVQLHDNRPVARILTEGGRATGLRFTDGSEVRSRLVLSCADPKVTFLRLLTDADIDPDLRQRVAGLISHVSCYKLLAAISELPRWAAWDGDPDEPSRGSMQLDMTRAIVSECYADLAAGEPPRRPMLSFNVPSMLDPTLAPAGHHTASIYIYPAPAKLARGTWAGRKQAVGEAIIDYITEFAPNFRRSILHHEFRTPEDLESKLGLTDGCIWHLQHTPEQLLGGRPLPELADYRTPLAGLYLGGAGQHPGGEVSGIPGHNAAQEILRDLGLQPSDA